MFKIFLTKVFETTKGWVIIDLVTIDGDVKKCFVKSDKFAGWGFDRELMVSDLKAGKLVSVGGLFDERGNLAGVEL
jgi:hypothetical protein